MSKMGISTLRSYRSSQIFEAVGVHRDVIDRYFAGTTSRIGGIGIGEIAEEVLIPHRKAFTEVHLRRSSRKEFYSLQEKRRKARMESETISLLQWSTRTGDRDKFREYSMLATPTMHHIGF